MHLLAREICDPAAAWARLSGGLPHGRETDRALDRGEGPAPGRAVFGSRPQIARIDPGGFCPPAFAVLVESLGRGPARNSVDRCGIVRRRSLRLVQRLVLAALWLLYMSFVHAGQDWYGYGWEVQLLETGFLAIFLCPLLDGRPFPRRAPPLVVLWLFRWLIFRIMLGAGLIKIRGDSCWRDVTALYYHFETQPLPNPLSRWFHFLPRRSCAAEWFSITWRNSWRHGSSSARA